MNIIDVLIILVILFGAVTGFKNGFTKQLISFIGTILVILLSFALKNYVSELLYTYLPFFKFGGILKGVTVLNIAIYEIIAFFLVFSVLMVILRVALFASKIFETVLKFTIILGIPSKILGAFVGALEYFLLVFIGLYILTLPVFDIEGMNHSKLRNQILNDTPILSKYSKDALSVFDEFKMLKEKYEVEDNANQFNLETLDVFLKYKIITPESVEKLIEKKKLQITNVDTVLEKYQNQDTEKKK